jgi:DNA-binding CsgD family transcriptional regulator
MTEYEAAIARMQEVARAENIRAGLNAVPLYSAHAWGDRPKPVGRRGPRQASTVAARRSKVMDLLASGKTRREIADLLGCSRDRVKSDIYMVKKLAGAAE